MAAKSESALVTSLKELGRVALMALVPVILAGINTETGFFDVDWRIVAAVVIVAVLRFIDKWLHTSGVAEKGLTRF